MGSGLLDADELKGHEFFSDLDFNKFLYKKFTPPNLNNFDGMSNLNKDKNDKAFHLSFLKKEMNINLKEDIANKKKSSERDIEGWTFIGRSTSKSMKNLRK